MGTSEVLRQEQTEASHERVLRPRQLQLSLLIVSRLTTSPRPMPLNKQQYVSEIIQLV